MVVTQCHQRGVIDVGDWLRRRPKQDTPYSVQEVLKLWLSCLAKGTRVDSLVWAIILLKLVGRKELKATAQICQGTA